LPQFEQYVIVIIVFFLLYVVLQIVMISIDEGYDNMDEMTKHSLVNKLNNINGGEVLGISSDVSIFVCNFKEGLY